MESNLRILNAFKSLKESIEKEKEKTELNKKNIDAHDKEFDKVSEKIQDIVTQVAENKKELKNEITDKIENIKIRVPKDGIDGKNGRDGKDGINGQDGKDGRDGRDGKNGINGQDGQDGKDGNDGVGILDADINEKGELILKLTDGRKINVGKVKGSDGIGYRGATGIGVKNAEIVNNHLYITLTDGNEIDAGYIGGGSGGTNDYNDLENKPIINSITLEGNMTLDELGIQPEGDYALSADIPTTLAELDEDTTHRVVTDTEKNTWNNKSDFSGDYEDLSNKPTIPVVPTNVSAFNNDAGYLTQHQDISGKYDKTGGEISGNVKIDGELTLDIKDEDYDAGIKFQQSLNTNLGTILTLTGYANGQEATNYKPIIRNVGTPNANYDVANKKYVDDNVVVPTYHLVFLNSDGTIDTYASTVNYAKISANLTDPKEADYLDIVWGNTRFYAKCIEITDVNSGDLKFIGEIEYQGIQRYMVFTLNPSNVLATTNIITFETISDKVQSVVSNSTSVNKYPSTKAVFDEFQRKPIVIWESNTPSEYLKAIQANLSANPAWQLTNLDMTPFKRIKIYSCAGQKSGSTASASTTPAIILEMSLDSRNAISAYGGNYVGSVVSQKPNDNNRLATLTCAVSADKTSFVVLRQTNLYGTAATRNDDVNANVFMIEGYYD